MKSVPSLFVSKLRGRLLAQAQGQGLGRHSNEDVMMLAEKDVRSVSTFLGKLFPFIAMMSQWASRHLQLPSVQLLVEPFV